MSNCLFCNIVAREIPADIVAETDVTLAFRDIEPQAPTHVLVVPKTHVDNADVIGAEHGDLVAAMVTTAQQVARNEGIAPSGDERGYRLVFNVGADASNSVPHLHMHVLGGRSLTWPPG